MITRRTTLRGFSLTEVLIVLVVISLLSAIVIPSGMRLAAVARSAECQSNLHAIAQGYTAYRSAEVADQVERQFSAQTWRSDLRVFLANHTGVFLCPEDRFPWSLMPVASIRVYDGGSLLYEIQLFDSDPYWLEGAHNDFLPDKPGMWRVNDDVYNGGNFDRYNMPQYTPGSNPKVSWWAIEDQRYGDEHQYAQGDQDFNDFDVKLTDLGGGLYDAEGFHGNAGYNFGIVDSDGVETREVGGTIGPLRMHAEGASYGVNWQVSRLGIGMHKILAMDYTNRVIYAGGNIPEARSNWDDDAVARHLGKANIAMTDGAVFSAKLEDIRPETGNNDAELWTAWSQR
ncbi:hypothetical protein LCGC14_0368920 [marine sediment metagenome]|uniref:Type II secretion system protein GspG C-terminal domain-containing protein n=1 Tax=marine sediment metagenome TaxID=412755 RepID=A0A0F9T5S0_9ZZZZ|nr:prepilin-type N-terminal cleavage/methylation domain-containing protein [Phycisphaerae bacterium]HDZ43161.1 prepilin-type N-terminal cleavage/methylation domain-containing protein [Phycisphaerae bacterium]